MPPSPDSRFEKAARPFGLVAAAVLVFMMLFTTVAVLLRQIFDYPILGLVEISELALIGCIFVAMPGAFLRDENIVVDVIDHVVPPRVTRVLHLIGLALTLAFVGATSYTMIAPALAKLRRDQYTMVLEIDRFYHWIPILFGFYLATAATTWLLAHRLRTGGPPASAHHVD